MRTEQNPKRILLIDDELSWLDFAKQILVDAGYAVQTSPSVKEGWELLRQEEFELILVDLKKVEQEKETFQKVAEIQMTRSHFVVAVFPTELTPSKVSEIFELGVHDCVDKQYNESKLLDLVNAQFKNKPASILFAKEHPENKPPTILIIEDDPDWRARLVDYLSSQFYQIEVTGRYSIAVKLLQEKLFDVIVLDLRLIDDDIVDFEGIKLLELLQKKRKRIPVIVISAYGTVKHVRDGFKLYNIFDYMSKQYFDKNKYQRTVQQAIQS